MCRCCRDITCDWWQHNRRSVVGPQMWKWTTVQSTADMSNRLRDLHYLHRVPVQPDLRARRNVQLHNDGRRVGRLWLYPARLLRRCTVHSSDYRRSLRTIPVQDNHVTRRLIAGALLAILIPTVACCAQSADVLQTASVGSKQKLIEAVLNRTSKLRHFRAVVAVASLGPQPMGDGLVWEGKRTLENHEFVWKRDADR